jgi:predicted nucleic acid-binding protein
LSSITEIELLCWKTTNEKDIEVLNDFIYNSEVIELEQGIKLKTASLRKSYNIKLPDAIIASTAIIYDLILLTKNISDFNKITELNILDPNTIK